MQRKQDRLDPERLLEHVITGLENKDANVYMNAVFTLLEQGPLGCSETLQRERAHPDTIPFDNGVNVPTAGLAGQELVRFLRSLVRRTKTDVWDTGLEIGGYTLNAQTDGRQVRWVVEGHVRDVVILQAQALIDLVGLTNVRICRAHECQRLFVKTYRREFCSVQCQQRVYKRRKRHEAREHARKLHEHRQAKRRRIAKGIH